jgi:CheY-like chemotaxis protein
MDPNSSKAFLLTAERVLDGCRQLERRMQTEGLRFEYVMELRRLSGAVRELGHLLESLLLNDQGTGASGRIASHAHVLVVDDDADTLKALSSALRMADLDVVTATNGVEALVAAHNSQPALLIMDLAMPTLGGVETTQLLKATSQTRAIPVIAHTARPESCRPYEPSLFVYVLEKPIDPEVLLPLVSHFVTPPMLD